MSYDALIASLRFHREALVFQPDWTIIADARAVLAGRRTVYWVIGGAAAGKSTVCRAIAARSGLPIYDMDTHIYGTYGPRYTSQRHPANTAWLAAKNPLAWALNLTGESFDAFNRAATAEYLDLLADDLRAWSPDTPILIDGGITHPSVVVQVLAARQMVCLATSAEERVRRWETAEERAVMREWVWALPEPEAMWRRFLAHDAVIAAALERESRAHQIPVIVRGPHNSVDELAQQVAVHLGVAV